MLRVSGHISVVDELYMELLCYFALCFSFDVGRGSFSFSTIVI